MCLRLNFAESYKKPYKCFNGILFVRLCQVRWPLAMKSSLTDLDTAVVKWVTAENAYRSCLTALERKSMEESEVRVRRMLLDKHY